MQKILIKRVFRDLKKNKFRYLALGLMIALSIFIVNALVGAAVTITNGSDEFHEQSHMEDGQFTVFVPLTDDEISELEKLGAEIEEHYSLMYKLSDDSELRVMKVRKSIDTANYISGEEPASDDEVAIERRYSEVHEISVGDEIEIDGVTYKVSGICVTADYDAPFKELTDTAVDSTSFGTAFLTDSGYESLKEKETFEKAEEYLYAYRLSGSLTDDDVKDYLQTLEIESNQIDDEYFQEYWEKTGGKLDDLRDALDELNDGAKELSDGLSEIDENSEDVKEGAKTIMESVLSEAQDSLEDYGLDEELTVDNYSTVLNDMKDNADSKILAMTIYNLIAQLDTLNDYRLGVSDYTDAVGDAADGSAELSDGISEMQEEAEKFLDEYADVSLTKLESFLTSEDNNRINGAKSDVELNMYAGYVAGLIIVMMFAYVISVFVVHGIEQESSVIGALYALGVKRENLLLHYITLPVAVTFLGGLVGTIFGSSTFGAEWQIADTASFFSLPDFEVHISVGMMIYGLVMPPLAAAIVNVVVIKKKLSRTALSLIRNEQKASKISDVKIESKSFITTFKIRQMIRESRSGIAVVVGMFVTLLILMLALDTLQICMYVKNDATADVNFEYMYTYKYPEEEVPEGGEAAYAYTMKKATLGYKFDVTLMGVEENSAYFDLPVMSGKNSVVLSNSAADKYGLKEGDTLVLQDEEADQTYAFEIAEIADYDASFYAFMNIDDLRELMGQDDDYYNVVFSDKALDIESERLYATTTKEMIETASVVFLNHMKSMIITLSSMSVVVFILVMYLMMKVMIDRSAMNIALIKVFGYRKREIKKLYLDGNFYIIAPGALVCIFLSKTIMDAIFPTLVANCNCGLDLSFPAWEYALMYAIILILYFIINNTLVSRINKISLAEVLKNRE